MSSLNRLTADSLDHNKLIIPIRKGVEIVQKPAVLKNNFVLLSLGFRHNYTMFSLDFSRIVYIER